MAKRINIIFTEDHKFLRQLLVKELEEHNIHTIGEAEDGIQLLELLKTNKPDIILLDLEMPNMNGCKAFEEIKKLYPLVKVIFLSTHNHNGLKEHLYSIGAKAFLTKNTDLDVIITTIRQVNDNSYKLPFSTTANHSQVQFSKRENEIIPLICEGKSNKEIADKLNIGNKTVEAHKKNLFKKTKTQSAVGFVSYIFNKGLNYLK